VSTARRRLRPGVRQLARLAEELAAACEGGILQESRVSGPELLALSIRVPGESVRLGLSMHPDAAGPLLLPGRPRRDAAAEQGSNFWQLLRASLPASHVERLRVPPGERSLILELRRGDERPVLLAAFHGGRPNLVLLENGTVKADLRGRVDRGATLDDLLRASPDPPRGGDEDPPLSLREWSRRLHAERAARLAGARLAALRGALAKAEAAARTRAERRLADAERLGDTSELRPRAEALAAHLDRVKKGDAELALPGWPDPENDPPLTIPLDRTREPADNLDRLWQRVRKADRGRDEALQRAEESEAEAAGLAALAERAEKLEPGALAGEPDALRDLDALEDEAAPRLPTPQAKGKRQGEAKALPFKRFTSLDGLPILVGRSSKANDELSLRIASGNDLWLHAHGVAGSHVVVKLPRGSEVPQETLLDAATLAHVFSKRKSDSHGEVTWCRAKHVSKRKGAPAGQVMVTQEKSLRVRVEAERLDRLKATEASA
jgi:predicted ribosome quality control (RQC) complex YloA/Tae2 family protein